MFPAGSHEGGTHYSQEGKEVLQEWSKGVKNILANGIDTEEEPLIRIESLMARREEGEAGKIVTREETGKERGEWD